MASITDGPRIISLRHRLIHGYYDISEAIVWGVIQQHLPVLDLEIKALRETYSTEFSEDGAEQ
ncbi:HepT-like ribonuclease domain-containing protein [Terriglobus sp. ADX1]|uniref:HepT-like ribonuclease domain-containing protein n=1 Tax=Terriglobus sp. ADX1 TaxID=2794063 RepID=UPI002FE5095B